MHALITGGLGYLGSRLMLTLPYTCNRISMTLIDHLKSKRLAPVLNLPLGIEYDFIEADIRDTPLDILIKSADVVIHLAHVYSSDMEHINPDHHDNEVDLINLQLTKLVATNCALYQKHLIHCSSIDSASPTQLASQHHWGNNSSYAQLKRSEELLLEQLVCDKNLSATHLRFGEFIGPAPGMRFDKGTVQKRIAQAFYQPGNIPSILDSSLSRDLLAVTTIDDACHSIAHIINHQLFHHNTIQCLTGHISEQQLYQHIAHHMLPDKQSNNQNHHKIIDTNIARSISDVFAVLEEARITGPLIFA